MTAVTIIGSLCSAGCGTTTKYVIANAAAPHAVSPDSPPTDECPAKCYRGRSFALRKKDREPIYDFDCLRACPNVRVEESECEAHEKAPPSFCEEQHEKGWAAEIIGGTIGLVVLGVVVVSAVKK